jgi:hypothetical protein
MLKMYQNLKQLFKVMFENSPVLGVCISGKVMKRLLSVTSFMLRIWMSSVLS